MTDSANAVDGTAPERARCRYCNAPLLQEWPLRRRDIWDAQRQVLLCMACAGVQDIADDIHTLREDLAQALKKIRALWTIGPRKALKAYKVRRSLR